MIMLDKTRHPLPRLISPPSHLFSHHLLSTTTLVLCSRTLRLSCWTRPDTLACCTCSRNYCPPSGTSTHSLKLMHAHSLSITLSNALPHRLDLTLKLSLDHLNLPLTPLLKLPPPPSSFRMGYGDKEMYWFAATIAREPFSFEPFLCATYVCYMP